MHDRPQPAGKVERIDHRAGRVTGRGVGRHGNAAEADHVAGMHRHVRFKIRVVRRLVANAQRLAVRPVGRLHEGQIGSGHVGFAAVCFHQHARCTEVIDMSVRVDNPADIMRIGKEFALARTEKKTGQGHKEFEITIGKEITIEEDLKRRDITINSIAKDVITGELIDPFNGREDIKNETIRATSVSFKEDPLRVYRVARFASEIGFKVEQNTINMMNNLKEELVTLSKERVFCEFRKALATNKPSVFFNVLRQADVLNIHFKEIYDLIGSLQPIEHHPEGDSYNHTMITVDNSTKLTKDLLVRYACLVHDLGKGQTPKEMYPHHYGHAEKGVEPARNLSNRIGVPASWKKAGIISCKEHMRRRNIFYHDS